MMHHLSPPMLEAMCRAMAKACNRDPNDTSSGYDPFSGSYTIPVWKVFAPGVQAAWAAGMEWRRANRSWDIGVGELNAPERQELYDLRRRFADAIRTLDRQGPGCTPRPQG